jgi:hypothetical protein
VRRVGEGSTRLVGAGIGAPGGEVRWATGGEAVGDWGRRCRRPGRGGGGFLPGWGSAVGWVTGGSAEGWVTGGSAPRTTEVRGARSKKVHLIFNQIILGIVVLNLHEKVRKPADTVTSRSCSDMLTYKLQATNAR